MKKNKKKFHSGIKQKVFNLVIITILLVMAAYTAVIINQYGNLSGLVKDTAESQRQSISEISGETMTAVLESNLTQMTQMEAYIAKDVFGDAVKVVNIISDYTERLFDDPDSFPQRVVPLPDKDKNGETCVQLLTEEGVDLSDPVISRKLGTLGNLSELMMAVYSQSNVDSCYVATTDGVMILVDNHSASKFDEEGNIIPIPIRDRLWYKGAASTGNLYFTDITTDLFTGEISIMCSLPVYSGGKLVAVIGADLFLNDVSSAVNGTARDGSFVCIINQNGHILFSPQEKGVFSVNSSKDSASLRELNNSELPKFFMEALESNTDLRLLDVGGTMYYLVGAPIQNVNWAVISVVPKSLADMPASVMVEKLNAIQGEATDAFSKGMSGARFTIFVLIAIVVIIAIASAAFLSRRIVKPLEAMTKRVKSLGGNDLQFKMEDAYRTNDEIEVLAESFANLSGKTLKYISEIERVTAEKERIGAELSLATRIQADMLPSIFPAFPDRNEFDVHASMNPAKEVGGDFYDFFLIDDDHLCLFIADVSGKGVPAALFMMASMIILANNAQMGKTPAQILGDTNAAICSNNREEMFVTVWLGILEISTGKLTAANAGHEYPVIKGPGGNFELLKDKHGFVLGGLDGAKYKEYEVMLKPGSKLFIYTDGVPEATNISKELFGTDRMVDALNTAKDKSAREVIEAVRDAVDGFVLEAEQFDDLTMLCLDYNGPDNKDEL